MHTPNKCEKTNPEKIVLNGIEFFYNKPNDLKSWCREAFESQEDRDNPGNCNWGYLSYDSAKSWCASIGKKLVPAYEIEQNCLQFAFLPKANPDQQYWTEGLTVVHMGQECAIQKMARGDGYAWANFEMRFKVYSFRFLNQNFYLATNPFFDMGACVQPYRLDEMKALRAQHEANRQQGLPTTLSDAEMNLIYTGNPLKLHMSAGIGFKIVMNRNFVLSAEFGIPLNTVIYSNTTLDVSADKLTTRKSYSPGINIGMNYIF